MDEIKCLYDSCSFAGFCKRHTYSTKLPFDAYFAFRPPITTDNKCTMFVPITALAEKIYRLSETPRSLEADMVFDTPKH
jgi:hypothetical protein